MPEAIGARTVATHRVRLDEIREWVLENDIQEISRNGAGFLSYTQRFLLLPAEGLWS